MVTTPTGRHGMVTIGNVLAAHSHLMNYSEGPDRSEIWDLTWSQAQARLAAGQPLTGDCSSTFEAVCKWAGCPIGPLGYTGTELQDMPRIPLTGALPGDAIVFGAPPGLHVVWVTKADPSNPSIDSHGRPGFDQTTLQQMWQAGFRGEPITVLSLAPFIPKPPPDPYHYGRFDTTRVHGLTNSAGAHTERLVVEKYDEYRPHLAAHPVLVGELENDCRTLAKRVQNNMVASHDPEGLEFNRKWRLAQLRARASGKRVVS